MNATDESPERFFKVIRNGNNTAENVGWFVGAENIRKSISEALNAKNVSFLIGAGCSSFLKDGCEVGIPTMQPLAQQFCRETIAIIAPGGNSEGADNCAEHVRSIQLPASETWEEDRIVEVPARAVRFEANQRSASTSWHLSKTEIDFLQSLGVDLEVLYSRNLERLLEVLFAERFVIQKSTNGAHWANREHLESIIAKVQNFLLEKLTQGKFSADDHTVRDLYVRFYRKLVLRDRSLPRPWVFTTNYDVFNETAMDRLGIPYANGFTGVIERRFNPSSFRYALAEQLDVSSKKWTAVDAFVYLVKLHGSISWTEDDHGLFPIREMWPLTDAGRMLIYPTPAKQSASLASPYADLFREFQSRIVREQSVLVTVGYMFGDEHINNIIYQALTIPTFRLIIFADPEIGGEIEKLRSLADPRIWIIGGDGPENGYFAHYFDIVIERFMPQRPTERVDDAILKALNVLKGSADGDDQ